MFRFEWTYIEGMLEVQIKIIKKGGVFIFVYLKSYNIRLFFGLDVSQVLKKLSRIFLNVCQWKTMRITLEIMPIHL